MRAWNEEIVEFVNVEAIRHYPELFTRRVAGAILEQSVSTSLVSPSCDHAGTPCRAQSPILALLVSRFTTNAFLAPELEHAPCKSLLSER